MTIVSGMILFLGDPERYLANPMFQLKALALVLAVINLVVFHLTVYSRVDEWERNARPPFAARICAGFSLTLWATVVIVSRLVAYRWG